MRENRLSDFIDAVLARPTMYTLDGSFEEVVAFLTGYFSGIALVQMNTPTVTVWRDFIVHVASTLDVCSSEALGKFRQVHESNTVDTLRKIYIEYRQTLQG